MTHQQLKGPRKMPIVDTDGDLLIAGERYKLTMGRSSLEVLISRDGKSLLSAINLFSAFFKIELGMYSLHSLPPHVKFEAIKELATY